MFGEVWMLGCWDVWMLGCWDVRKDQLSHARPLMGRRIIVIIIHRLAHSAGPGIVKQRVEWMQAETESVA